MYTQVKKEGRTRQESSNARMYKYNTVRQWSIGKPMENYRPADFTGKYESLEEAQLNINMYITCNNWDIEKVKIEKINYSKNPVIVRVYLNK